MKQAVISSLVTLSALFSFAQSSKQVQWSYTAKKIADKTYEVHFSATINAGYHLYAQSASAESIEATSFSFTPNPLISFNGKIRESGKPISRYEAALHHEVKYYEKEAVFAQTIRLKANAKTDLVGKVTFTVCNDRSCLPTSDVDVRVKVGG